MASSGSQVSCHVQVPRSHDMAIQNGTELRACHSAPGFEAVHMPLLQESGMPFDLIEQATTAGHLLINNAISF